MKLDLLYGFGAGVVVGATVALTSTYFTGTTILRKTLREYDENYSPPTHHLDAARAALNEEPVPVPEPEE